MLIKTALRCSVACHEHQLLIMLQLALEQFLQSAHNEHQLLVMLQLADNQQLKNSLQTALT
jgi:hypothetical protein